MSSEIIILCITAASIGFMHTLLGPDHYLPFVVLSKARKWSRTKTAWITILCGVGHVASSVVIGFIGIAAGIALSKLEYFESFRGNIAGWLFIAFGLLYGIWGLKRAFSKHPHTHSHFHLDGSRHVHEHSHQSEHVHIHEDDSNEMKTDYKKLTPWILFVIFVFGPCEPLIPILMFPALQHSMVGVAIVSMVFAIVTICTMLAIVLLMSTGLSFVNLKSLEKYSHALAGGTIFLSGMAIQFLGL